MQISDDKKAKILACRANELLNLAEKAGNAHLLKSYSSGNIGFEEISAKLNLEEDYFQYKKRLSELTNYQHEEMMNLVSQYELFILAHICLPD